VQNTTRAVSCARMPVALYTFCAGLYLAACESGQATLGNRVPADASADAALFDANSGTGSSDTPVTASSPDRWEPMNREEDPLANHQVEGNECHPSGWKVEEGTLEVLTGPCPYFRAAQLSRVTIGSGDRVKVDLWHTRLVAPEPATAHVALLVNGAVIAERWVAIPAEPNVLSLEGDVDVAHAGAAKIALHLHNHGANGWSFGDVNVQRALGKQRP
jgi:hypothetical protein